MTDTDRIVFACSCEDTMPLDRAALRQCGGEVRLSDNLCRARLDSFRAALTERRPMTVGCTQEAPLFQEIAEEAGRGDIAFANIRESAGWSDAGRAAGPKMAALLAASAEPVPAAPLVSLVSEGKALVYGRDATALAVAGRLHDTLDVTVLLTPAGHVVPPATGAIPVRAGTIAGARGHLGAFELTVNGFAHATPSSRARLAWGAVRDGVVSRCDIVLDVTGAPPLFPIGAQRAGYLRADPGRSETVERLIAEAAKLVGTFDKPRYVAFRAALCAHGRNRRTGCTRCLDLCPAGAIAPAGDCVAVDAALCAGCGACAAACPTGAITTAVPPAAALLRRARTLLLTYAAAGGRRAVLLLHDGHEGQALIDAAARLGRGLPANVLPLGVNEVTQCGLGLVAAAFAWGAAGMVFLTSALPRHDTAGLHRTAALAGALLTALGLSPGACAVLETDDPDALTALRAGGPGSAAPSRFLPVGEGRDLTVAALKALHTAFPPAPGAIALQEGAPFGAVVVDADACTLCLACVAACPTAALRDDPDRPALRFVEAACVQCGLCRATCPERVVALVPRLDLAAWGAPAVTLKQEEPYPCIACGRPFASRGSVERVVAKLAGSHWMFSGANAKRLDVLRLCERCRVEAAITAGFDPHAAPRSQADLD